MSYTEIFGFDKNGDAYFEGETNNAFRSAMSIWRILEEKYLPPYRPSYVPDDIPDSKIESFCKYKPSRCSAVLDEEAIKEVWNLAHDKNVSRVDKVVIFTTFDRCLVERKDIETVINAFESFEGETSLKEQAKILRKLFKDEGCIAVGWNQTSVNADTWGNYDYDYERDESIPYNCIKQDKHFWLSKYIKG